MPRPRNRLQPLLLHGLPAFHAQAEIAFVVPAQRRLNQREKIPRIAALLEQGFLGVATVGLVSHILSAHDVRPAAVQLEPCNSRQQLPFLGQQPLSIGFRHLSSHFLNAHGDSKILWIAGRIVNLDLRQYSTGTKEVLWYAFRREIRLTYRDTAPAPEWGRHYGPETPHSAKRRGYL